MVKMHYKVWYALEREKEYVERGFIPKRGSMRYSELAKRQDVQISAKVDCIILSVNGQTQSFGNCNGNGNGNGNGGSETGGRTATKGVHCVASGHTPRSEWISIIHLGEKGRQ